AHPSIEARWAERVRAIRAHLLGRSARHDRTRIHARRGRVRAAERVALSLRRHDGPCDALGHRASYQREEIFAILLDNLRQSCLAGLHRWDRQDGWAG